MTNNYTKKGKGNISMYEYKKLLTELPKDMNGASTRPAATHLFNVNPEVKKLTKEIA